jgi:catalase
MSVRPSESKQAEFTTLSRGSVLARCAVIVVVMAGIVGSFAYAGGWLSPRTLSPASMIDTFEKVNGLYPGFRRNHAKGVGVSGYFESNGHGVELSRAAVFPAGRVPVIGRFAFSGGQPFVADSPQLVRSLAVLFRLQDGEEWRTGMLNIPVFPVNTARALHDELLASASDPTTGKPDPSNMKAFLAGHPETARALQLIRNYPVSSGFDNSTYHALNAFLFISARGAVVPVRWSMVPVQPFEPVGPADPGTSDKNYLFDALIARIHRRPLQWRLIVTVGQPGDPTNDATIAWPADRRQIDVGTLTIERIESEETSPARDINFDPLVLPNGMAASDDPLLSARSAAYSQSFTRREGERKTPSAISAAESRR